MVLLSQNKNGNTVELEIRVEGQQFKDAVEASLRKNMPKIALPGFRKGKAPRPLVIKTYGMGMFVEEAVEDLYPKAYRHFAEELDLDPVDTAGIDITDLDEENGFTFKATITVKPEATVSEYKGLEIEKESAEVTDVEVAEQLASIADQNARIVPVTDRPAKNGDTAFINFEGFVDDVAFEGGKGEGHPLKLGSGSFIPGFEEQVEGHSIGEEFDVKVTFPEEYHAEELAGKEAVFKCSINEINESVAPVLDDEFAKDVSEFDTLDEYKADIKEKLQAQKDEASQRKFENDLMLKVVENSTVDIPEVMIENRINELLQNFAQRLSAQGLDMNMFMQYAGGDQSTIRNSFRAEAENNVKVRLALEAVARAEGIEVTDEELEEEFAKLAPLYGVDVEMVKAAIPHKDLKGDILCTKALDLIKESAVVK